MSNPNQIFVENEGVVFRGQQDPDFPPRLTEKLVDGKWVPAGMSGVEARSNGSVLEEDEAQEYAESAGEQWPAS